MGSVGDDSDHDIGDSESDSGVMKRMMMRDGGRGVMVLLMVRLVVGVTVKMIVRLTVD